VGMEKFRARYGISSKLQEDILSYVCRNSDGTYNILCTHTDRNERTIGQSVRTLEKNFYVEKQEIKKGKNRSNYVVVPTLKGIYYGLAYLNLDFFDYLKAHGDEDDQSQFSEYRQKIEDYNKWSDYNKYNSRLFFENNLFNEGMPFHTSFEDAFNMGVKIGLSAAAQSSSDSSAPYITKQGIKIAKDILEPRKLQDLKNFWDEK
jgi:hypothetical protein